MSNMKEYFNLDIESNLELKKPKELREGSLFMAGKYLNDDNDRLETLTVMTPPLRCSNVRVWEGERYNYSKCELELNMTENEWRFGQFLSDIGSRSKRIIMKNSKKWFGYTFSPKNLRSSYSNLFVERHNNEPDRIKIQLSKKLLKTLDRKKAKSYKNQFLVLRLIFKGILISNGVFTEVWRGEQVFKAAANFGSDEDDEEYDDIGELNLDENTFNIKKNNNDEEVQEEVVKEIQEEEIQEVEEEAEEEVQEEEVQEVEEEAEEEVQEEEVQEVKEEVVQEEIKKVEIKKKKPKRRKKKIILSNNRKRKL